MQEEKDADKRETAREDAKEQNQNDSPGSAEADSSEIDGWLTIVTDAENRVVRTTLSEGNVIPQNDSPNVKTTAVKIRRTIYIYDAEGRQTKRIS